jgi:hypothetical protein
MVVNVTNVLGQSLCQVFGTQQIYRRSDPCQCGLEHRWHPKGRFISETSVVNKRRAYNEHGYHPCGICTLMKTSVMVYFMLVYTIPYPREAKEEYLR